MMARHPSNKLTALAVKKQTTPGRYRDGNGLYLVVDPSGAKRWLQRLSVQGKRCDLGLGSKRLDMVINWARGKRLYTGDDPIKMAELSLPKTKQSKNHFKSLNYDEMPSLFEEIEASSATT